MNVLKEGVIRMVLLLFITEFFQQEPK